MKTILAMAAIVLLTFGLEACKKYPEGPTVSLLPRRERIEGKWVAGKVIQNQAEITAQYKNHIWEFTRQYSVIHSVDSVRTFGVWNTMTRDKDFVIDYDNGDREIYEIRKMLKDEFWIRDRQSNIEFQLKPY